MHLANYFNIIISHAAEKSIDGTTIQSLAARRQDARNFVSGTPFRSAGQSTGI